MTAPLTSRGFQQYRALTTDFLGVVGVEALAVNLIPGPWLHSLMTVSMPCSGAAHCAGTHAAVVRPHEHGCSGRVKSRLQQKEADAVGGACRERCSSSD